MSSRWLGALPKRWREGRLDQVASAWPSNVDKHSVEGQVPVRLCNYTDVYKNDVIIEGMDFMVATATLEQVERFRVARGDTLITKDSETAEDIGVPAYVDYEAGDLVCGYHLAIVRPTEHANPRYLYWVMASESTLRQWAVTAAGVTRVGIRSTDLSKVAIPVPPLDVQRSIADYLDHETAQIDVLITEQQRLVSLLSERRQAAMDRVLGVRVGFGERLRWSVTEVDARAGGRAAALPLLSVSISWGVRRREDAVGEDSRAEGLSNYKVCTQGDLVINRMRAFQGALGLAAEDGVVSPDYAVLNVAEDMDPQWLVAVMRTPSFVAEMAKRVKGIGSADLGSARTPRINVADLGEIRIAAPSRDQQAAEVSDLADELERLDLLTLEVERFIELARERRASLITAAVTGQIDVWEAA